ncbi:MAG: hypothetical protein ACFBSE_09645 [Prochloraceae cyanobacterium]
MSKSSQQIWNERNPKSLLEAQKKYRQRYKQISFKINKEERQELIDWYNNLSKEEKSEFFASIIDYMEKYKNSK